MVKNEHYLWLKNSICKNYSFEVILNAINYLKNDIQAKININENKKIDIKEFHNIENKTDLSRNHFHILITIFLDNTIIDIKYVINNYFKK
ncbi:hypothetical protein [Spiroplasma endosymbiont of Labia minor]|uniref:hypothetical protein n=1 Tax=Spiroplasma endosymbiont of Labia minor TaxID=3066305 RepID=UPI0030D0A2F6